MRQAVFHAEQYKTIQAVQSGNIDSNAVIASMELVDGSYHVLSRYGDPVWVLPDSMFSAGVKDNVKKLDFSRIPAPFRETLRFLMARYILVGIEGRDPPRGGTIRGFFVTASQFLTWLEEQDVDRLSDVTPLVSQQYVTFCRRVRNRKGEPLAAQTLTHRFAALEKLHFLSQRYDDPMPHPWPESSAKHLAGGTGQTRLSGQEAKTQVIPDDILGPLFQSAVEWLDRADEVSQLRTKIDAWQADGMSYWQIRARLQKRGWTPRQVHDSERFLQSACMCIILVTSGIRVSELCSLESQAAFKTLDDDGDPFYWMRGLTYKTTGGAQDCEWLVSEITHRAIAVAERLAQPLQTRLEHLINELRAETPSDPEISRLHKDKDRLFLATSTRGENQIGTISAAGIIARLNAVAAQCGLNWHFAPHQFRRTFAVYAAHSAFGDLRYLRDHFKHWNLDMTTLYAMSEDRDQELVDEINRAVLDARTDLVEHWFEPDAILTGGASEPVRTFRTRNKGELLRTKADRRKMAEQISHLVYIRATGVAWCTADFDGCNGGQGVEKTRCADCANAVIDESQKAAWQGIYAQQRELLYLDDLGPGGQAQVERSLRNAENVLKGLGATEEDLADVGT
ncbi:hypothetical protein ABGV17_01605 [Guyparkeria sp. GHLCS8-2]|uniref:hypothetical protein n=1 Tax=Guyparkeria halopsychrophila TaxID=3139421 RepID=UPI0037C67109